MAAKFAAGQRVKLLFNEAKTDPKVPQQSQEWINSKGQTEKAAPGTGNYQTEPDYGTVIEVRTRGDKVAYLVAVELTSVTERNGRKYKVQSVRDREVAEEKLEAVAE